MLKKSKMIDYTRIIGTFIILSLLTVFVPVDAAMAASRKSPSMVQHYAIYFGTPDAAKIKELRKFDLVVVAQDKFTPAQVQSIKRDGAIVLGYLPSLIMNKSNPQFSGLLPGDILTVDGQPLETAGENTDVTLLDPRSTHLREVVKEAIQNQIYNKGMDGVLLDGLNQPSEFLSDYVSLDSTALENLRQELFAATVDFLREIKAMNNSKYIGQNNGWGELINNTGPDLNFLFWSGYSPDLCDTDPWVEERRREVLADKDTYGVVPLAYRVVSKGDTPAVKQFYDTVRAQGFIPYAVADGFQEINTYGLPASLTGTRLPYHVKNYQVAYGNLSASQVEAMKRFDLAIVGPEINDAQLKELQSAGVIVCCYIPTTSIDIKYPSYTGLSSQDYLQVNGKRVINNNDSLPDYIMDPRSTHYRQVVVNTIKKEIYARGFDGVFLDTLNQGAEYLGGYVSLEPTALSNLREELMTASAQLCREIREADRGKIIIQNNGWRELVNLTAPYIDFLMWEDYPYQLGASDTWLNQKRDNLIHLKKRYNFQVLAARLSGSGDYSWVQKFYEDTRSYGFIPSQPLY